MRLTDRLCALGLSVAIVAAACNSSEAPPTTATQPQDPPVSNPKTPPFDAAEEPIDEVRTVLDLPAGEASTQFFFNAPDVRTHAFTVQVSKEPPEAVLTIWIDTPDGTLQVLDEIRLGSCRLEGNGTVCELEFPALEGQRGGSWEMNIRKSSALPAQLVVTVTFHRV